MNTVFDIRTLLATLCMSMFVLSLCMGYYSYSRKTYSGFDAWTIATILQALGSLFIGLRTVLPDFITIILANLFLFSGMFLIYYGFKSFADEKVKIAFNIIVLLVFSLIFFPFFTYTAPSVNARIVISSAIIAGYFFFCTLVFVKTSRHGLLKINKLVATTLILSCLLYFSRGILYLIQTNTVNSFMSAGIFIEISLLLTIMLFISLVIGFMQLNSERLEIELSQKHEKLTQSKEKFRSLSDATLCDFTERKQAEEELKKLGAAVRQSPISIVITDLNGKIEYVNPKFCNLTGYSEKEVLGKNPRVLNSGETPEEIYEQLWEAILAGKEWHGELRNKKKNGDLYWENALITPVLDRDQNPTHFLGIKEDITERKQIEEALRQSETKFKNLIESSSDWIWEINSESVYTYASPLVEKMLGYKPEEIIGKTPYDLMPPEEAEKIAKVIKGILEKSKPIVALENVNLHKNGQHIILETSGVPVFDKAGTITHYRGVDRDITERKQIEEEREHLIKELQEAIEEIKTLSGLVPICSNCKKIRDDKGYWNILESYLQKHTNALFSHGICPECSDKLYGKEDWYIKMKKKEKEYIDS